MEASTQVLRRRNKTPMFKILSIDGGGIKGVFPASFLATIEEKVDGAVWEYFDLIAGTSTGAVIALGLGLGLCAREILRLYEEEGPRIFPAQSRWRSLFQLFSTKYRQEPLRHALEWVFGERLLGESKTRLLIPSVNLEAGEVHVYKTAHHSRLEYDHKEKVVGIALATAAAPSYFPISKSPWGVLHIDGGLCANNPVGMAVVEALGVLNQKADELRVLSLGCTSTPLSVNPGKNLHKGLFWIIRHYRLLLDISMAAQSALSYGIAEILAGNENVIRYNPMVGRGRYELDRVEDIESLKARGRTEARSALPRLKELFFDQKAEPFVPCHRVECGFPRDS